MLAILLNPRFWGLGSCTMTCKSFPRPTASNNPWRMEHCHCTCTCSLYFSTRAGLDRRHSARHADLVCRQLSYSALLTGYAFFDFYITQQAHTSSDFQSCRTCYMLSMQRMTNLCVPCCVRSPCRSLSFVNLLSERLSSPRSLHLLSTKFTLKLRSSCSLFLLPVASLPILLPSPPPPPPQQTNVTSAVSLLSLFPSDPYLLALSPPPSSSFVSLSVLLQFTLTRPLPRLSSTV